METHPGGAHRFSSAGLRGLIDEDRARNRFRVHRSTLTDPAILEIERERIFDRCWLYLGHESELAGPGSFVARTINHRPLIFVRDGEGRIRAFFNVCRIAAPWSAGSGRGRRRASSAPITAGPSPTRAG